MLVTFSFEYANTVSFQASLICVVQSHMIGDSIQESFSCFKSFFLALKTQLENKIASFNGKN